MNNTVNFEIHTRADGAATIIELSGRIVLGEATNRLRGTIRELIESGQTNIVVTLSDVTFLDSAGLGELIASYKRILQHGGRLRLAGPTHQIRQLLESTHLINVLEVYDDTVAALAS